MKEIIKVIQGKEKTTVEVKGTETEIIVALGEIFKQLVDIDEKERVTTLIYLYQQLTEKEKYMFCRFMTENPDYV